MDIDVGYNAMVVSFEDTGYELTGKLKVFTGLVVDKVLMPELRFKNSSYGASMQAGRTGVLMYSYRDPKLAETFDIYDSLGDMVHSLELTQEDIDGFIVSVFSEMSMPMGPMTGGEQAVSDKLNCLDSFSDTLRYMHEAKQTTVEDIRELAGLCDVLAEKGARISVHSQKLVEENSGMFARTDDCFMFSGSGMGDLMDMFSEGWTDEEPVEEPAEESDEGAETAQDAA